MGCASSKATSAREATLAALQAALADALGGDAAHRVDLVVSDMAPNLSGVEEADAARIEHLIELAVDFAVAHLKPDGALVAKVFHGGGVRRGGGAAVSAHFRDRRAQAQGVAPPSRRKPSWLGWV